MLRQPLITKDGSHTIAIPEMNVTYHSIHGAIRESQHVFIDAGLKGSGRLRNLIEMKFNSSNRPDPLNPKSRLSGTVQILEMGFGTGLNALLTLAEAEKQQSAIHYTAIELFPLSTEEAGSLNYCRELSRPDFQLVFKQLHQSDWEKEIIITPFFTLHKTNQSLTTFSTDQVFDLVYFDAFAPAAQPELWTKEIFEKLYAMMSRGGILVTYCSKGDVRRAMMAAGFNTEKIPGPPGKREMLRAGKGG